MALAIGHDLAYGATYIERHKLNTSGITKVGNGNAEENVLDLHC